MNINCDKLLEKPSRNINNLLLIFDYFDSNIKINIYSNDIAFCDNKNIILNRFDPKIHLNEFLSFGGAYFDHEKLEINIGNPESIIDFIYKSFHEYGHYISFINNGYTEQLIKERLQIKQQKSEITDLIFQEEINAWENFEKWFGSTKKEHRLIATLTGQWEHLKHWSLRTYSKSKYIKWLENQESSI